MTNRDVFAVDPTEGDIPNLGVAKVKNPEDDGDWKTLDWELRSFVCSGEYGRGLDRILDQYLSHLSQAEQPAVWVSGFYGSGKSHLMRVLEYLWRDLQLPGGASARDLVTLPDEIRRHLTELSNAAKRVGGLWSAAGTLGSGVSGSARLAFLGVVFNAADLPEQYAPAGLALWLHGQGMYDAVRVAVEAAGKQLSSELRNLYVSPVLAKALIDAGASFGDSPAAVSAALRDQFPMRDDISNEEMLTAFEQVLKLKSTTPGKVPLTLVVLDEMQQYINEDNEKALNVQDLVEACSSRFDSQVLVVATGQMALTSTPTLQKLIDRFSVSVALSDTDVETVVREVVLRKKPEAIGTIETALDQVSGEIDRQLGGTKLAATAADKQFLISDYPLLPTRRRFWERALRAIDKAGKSGVLRTQLKIVHEAARSVADEPLGTVIGGDFVFRSESASMQQSGVLSKQIDEVIRGLDDGSEDGGLKSRACALVFLIAQLPRDPGVDTGVRATSAVIGDLLVCDLAGDGAPIRKEVPRLLDELVEAGRLMKVEDEYVLQTEEGAEWSKNFSQRRAALRDDAARLAQLRSKWLLDAVDAALAGTKINQGESLTPRKTERVWGETEPAVGQGTVPLWIRDEWEVTESKARQAATEAGTESPIVFVLLPRIEADAIRDSLTAYQAAVDTVSQRPEPQTDDGRQAKRGMQSRIADEESRLNSLFTAIVTKARVFQGGGNEISGSTLKQAVETAANHSLVRMFPKFPTGDDAHWDKVIGKARDGALDALKAIGYDGDVTSHPVCKEVLARTSGAGTKGSDLHQQLGGEPYGWPKDAIDAALLVLLASGNVRAERDGLAFSGPKELPPTQIGKATFFKEDQPPTMQERLAVRGLLTDAKVPFTPGEEGASISGLLQHLKELASRAGGTPPLPELPDTAHVNALTTSAGNQQFREVAANAEQLRQDIKLWSAASAQAEERRRAWDILERLITHAAALPTASEAKASRDAIHDDRLLLHDPDPVAPVVQKLAPALRNEVTAARERLVNAQRKVVEELAKTPGWSEVADDERAVLLADADLVEPPEPDLETVPALLSALDARPLRSYQDRIDALPAKAASVRQKLVALTDPEPEIVTVSLVGATLKTADDVDAYLAALRTRLLAPIQDGKTVVI